MINRAKLRGKLLDRDCSLAHTTKHEYGLKDDRIFCYGLSDPKTDEPIHKCLNCKAHNAEPLAKTDEQD